MSKRPSAKPPRRALTRYTFPYVRFHDRAYPLIPLTLKRGRFSVNTFALIDSGASISVFRPEIAKALHIPLHNRRSSTYGTAGGGVNIGVSPVVMEIEDTRFKTRIGFSDSYVASFNILGREGFFHRFSICFNEIMRTVILVPLHKMRSR